MTPQLRHKMGTIAGEGLRMALLSVFSLGLGYALTTLLTLGVGLDPKLAYGCAVIACSVVNFFGCRHYVFRGGKERVWHEAVKFFPSVLLFRAIEVALFSAILASWSNFHVAYFATAVISMVCKLLLSRIFIFKRSPL